MSSPAPIVVWIKSRGSYVENHPNVVLRVKNSAKFGENLRGFSDGHGELVELSWPSVLSLSPTSLEINHSRNPLRQLVEAIEKTTNQQEIRDFFSRLRSISIFGSDSSALHLQYLLGKLDLLAAFSYSDIPYSEEDWKGIVKHLLRLNLRSLDMSGGRGCLENVLSKLDVELLQLSGNPGVRVSELKSHPSTFITVQHLIVSELLYEGDSDAEEFLSLLPSRFPRVRNLVIDWSIIDPAITIDERAEKVVKQIVEVNSSLSLESLVIIAYSPCTDSKHASGEVARKLGEAGLSEVRLHRFASKGLSNGIQNFTAIICGPSIPTRSFFESVIVEGRCTIPTLSALLPLIDPLSTLHKPSLSVDFGGFDNETIKKTWKEKDWESTVEL